MSTNLHWFPERKGAVIVLYHEAVKFSFITEKVVFGELIEYFLCLFLER